MEQIIVNMGVVVSGVIIFAGAGFYFKSKEWHDKIRSVGIISMGNVLMLLSFIFKALTG